MLNRHLGALALLAVLSLPATVRGGDTTTIYLLTTTGQLATVPIASSGTPAAVSAPVAISGVTAGETLVAIDVRPQTQRLYALGVNPTADTATLYHLSPETAFAAIVGTGSLGLSDGVNPIDFPDPATVGWDMDFNPAADRLRVVAGSLNFRMNPNDGSMVDFAGGTGGVNPDGAINTGTTTVNMTAYTNNQPNNGNVTTLYTLDAASDALYIQNPPNNGTQTLVAAITLGGSPLNFSAAGTGFDIAPGVNAPASGMPVTTGSGFALLNVGGTFSLYSINLVNGQAALIGSPNVSARSMALRTTLGPAIAMNAAGDTLIRFDTATPGTTTSQALATGSLVAGETLVGIDFRPQTGQLMGLGINATANTGTIYLVDPQNGALTAIAASAVLFVLTDGTTPVDFPDPATIGYGFDFNPMVDRIRVTTSNGLNFRANPNTGASVDGDTGSPGVNPDGNINGNGSTGVSGAAYTQSFGRTLGTGTTTLYTLDAAQNIIFIQNPPNAGTQTSPLPLTLGGNPLDVTDVNGFDIAASVATVPESWIVATVGGVTGLYRVDLGTGAATFLGNIGTGATAIRGLTVFTTAQMRVEASSTVLVDNLGTISFGTVLAGTGNFTTFAIFNTGSQALTYTALATPAEFFVTSNGSGTIAPGGNVTVQLTFGSIDIETVNGTVTITNNDATVQSFEIALTGTTFGAPGIASPTSAAIMTTTASLGGNITADNNAAITERGVVYARTSVNADPFIGDPDVLQIIDTGTAVGVFTVPVTGLTLNTGYTFKAYAINNGGTSYTSAATFTTADNAPPSNNVPQIASGPTATPATAGVGQTVTFGIVATDADGQTLSYSWNIDGAVKTGAAPTHVFVAAGVYTVTVTVSDGAGGTAEGSVQVTVKAPLVGSGNDSDGDGFSDSFETAVGTSPSNAADSPTGGAAPVVNALTQAKLAIKLNFAKAASDSIAFSGTLPIAAGFSAANKTAIIDVGGAVKMVTLDAKGKSPQGNNAFKLTIKVKKGVVAAQTAKFSVKLSKGDFAAALADEGLTNTTVSKANASVLVRIIFAGAVYEHLQAVVYMGKAGKSGAAKAAK